MCCLLITKPCNSNYMSKETSQEPLPSASLPAAAPRPTKISWGQGRLAAAAGPPSVAPLVPARQGPRFRGLSWRGCKEK